VFFSLESPGNSAEMSVQTLLSILVHASGRTDVEPTRAAVLVLVLLGDGCRGDVLVLVLLGDSCGDVSAGVAR